MQKINYELVIDYKPLMGEWSELLKPILSESYMYSLMLTLHENYKNKKDYYPAKKDIFKTFNDVKLKNINVVMVNCHPSFNNRSNGLAFGNKDALGNNFDTSLIHLFNQIENHLHGGLKIDKDYTLSEWSEQGVFLLNTALTGSSEKADIIQWSRFTEYVLTYLSNILSNTIFVFFGDNLLNPLSDNINEKKHIVLKFNSLNVDALEDINIEIDALNGKDYRIQW